MVDYLRQGNTSYYDGELKPTFGGWKSLLAVHSPVAEEVLLITTDS
jgi:hypothetical protein